MKLARVRVDGYERLATVNPAAGRLELRTPAHASAPGAELDELLAMGHKEDVAVGSAITHDFDDPAVTWLPPVRAPRLIVCAGQNFSDHAGETSGGRHAGLEPPSRPSAFLRVPRTLAAHREAVSYPAETRQLDYEVEVAALIGHDVTDVTANNALSYVAGYCLANDVTARDIQLDETRSGSMLRGKNLPGTLPLGPWVTTVDEVPDPGAVEVRCDVDDSPRQAARLSSMIWSFAELIAYWSVLGLRAGDIVLSGTPAGVGLFAADPETALLHPGQTVRCSSPQLGVLENRIVCTREEERSLP